MTKERDFAIKLARKAGRIIKDNFGKATKEEWKADNTPVTKTDKTINRLVIDSIKKQFPGQSVWSEEGSFFVKNSQYTWVCDPLDGTLAFLRGIPVATFALALVRNGKSILGVIYDPFSDKIFFAEKGKGAFLNNKKISVSLNKNLARAVVGFSWGKGHRFNLYGVFGALKEKETRVFTIGSAVYMGALVASGGFDAYITSFNKPFEAAAFKIIIEEAGGKVTDLFGQDQRYDKGLKGFVASNGVLHSQLLSLIKRNLKQ